MNIFKNKFLVKLIASICIILTLTNMGIPNMSYAANDDPVWGGILINPVTKLLTSLADGIMAILHKAVLEQRVSLITISGNPSWWEKVGTIVVKVLVGAALVAVVAVIAIVSYGVAAPAAIAAAGVIVGGTEVISSAIMSSALGTEQEGLVSGLGTVVAKKMGNWLFDRDLFLPVFNLTPDRIFANQILMFDVNFFNPSKRYETDIIKEPLEREWTIEKNMTIETWEDGGNRRRRKYYI